MNMKFLNRVILKEPEYKKLLSDAKSGNLPIAATGLSAVHKAVFTASLVEHTNKKAVVFTPDEASAVTLCNDLTALSLTALNLPARDYNLLRVSGFSREYEHKRINTLSKIIGGDFDVLVLSVESAFIYTVPPEILRKVSIKIDSTSLVNTEELIANLVEAGYVRSELTEGAGQFSVRGGIIDIFPVNCDNPVRIELWGDEVDSISEFDPISQRRGNRVEKIEISPACELPLSSSALKEKLENYLNTQRKLTDSQTSYIQKDIDLLVGGVQISPDPYLNLLYDEKATIFEYVTDCLKIVCESGNMADRIKSIETQHSEDIKSLLENGFLSKKTADIYIDKGQFLSKTAECVYLESFPRSAYSVALKGYYGFNLKRLSSWSGDIELLKEDLALVTRTKGLAVILAGEQRAARVLAEELNEKGITATLALSDEAIGEKGVYVATGGLSAGMEIPSINFVLISHKYIPPEEKKRYKRPKNAKEIGSLDELHRGDYVVHSGHGIGIFDGINRITNSGVTKDYIKIKYAGTDVLYVPVTQLDLVSKYIGAAEDGAIKLNKLGTQAWERTRSRVRAAVKNMAKQLTALYAKRMATRGYAFSEDTDLQNNFERRFEYEETEDQLRCVNEIKRDMERDVPMDRLLCGDVGFGKTEVALRAAFKCIAEGKQCALLVPTTILAMQHFTTITRRFGDLPVTVKLLNRFVSKKEQEKTVAGLKSGRVDMVVGTHRLISSDVKFKNIGLVIIDEEQRFGVAQKERLKELYPFVDILTLSATPIPRTLNMAMSGLRDMSTIDEAPGDRYPVQSYVLEQNMGVLIDAINREIRRGGQVYYLHNRVESIVSCAAKLKNLLPEARIGVAHGKMSEDELSEVWQKLIDYELDVLVCTTIIETGVDVPNANTLIIENADRMGLSQLHQLRGRVGRSSRRAYAYFCFNGNKSLSEVAQKRLEAIREFTEFGSGFKIAMRDLEIRGAGSILGGEQHGNMEAVGYDMYLKLLSEAVNEENGIETKPQVDCTVDLNISAHIPESYIKSLPARLGIYKRIADISDEADTEDVVDELCDRFGEPPKAVMGLINIALVRNKASASGIYEINQTVNAAILKTDKLREEVGKKLADTFKERFTVSPTGTTAYVIKLEKNESIYELLTKLSKVL